MDGLSKENINIEKVDINSFMNELYNTTKDELGNIRLQLDVEKSYVLADKVLLEDCLRNLIDNSKKANPKDYLIKIIGKGKVLTGNHMADGICRSGL